MNYVDLRCRYCRTHPLEDCPRNTKLYIYCPNILASQYAQSKLRDIFGFQIIKGGNQPHFSSVFVVINPPCQYSKDKPIICSVADPHDKKINWIPMMEALQLITMITKKIRRT